MHLFNPGILRDLPGRVLVVAGQQDQAKARLLQPSECVHRLRFERVAQGEHPEGLALAGNRDHRPAHSLKRRNATGKARKIDAAIRKEARAADDDLFPVDMRSEEHTSELQSLMRISYAVFCL